MNSIDIIIIIYLCALGLVGFIKGFTSEILGMVAVIGGIIFSYIAGESVGSLLNNVIPGDKLPYFLGYILAFLIIYASAKFLEKALQKVITIANLKGIDGLMGALVGALKAMIIIAMLLTALVMYPVQHLSAMVANSTICQMVLTEENLEKLRTTVIPKIKQTIDEGKELIEKNLPFSETQSPEEQKEN